jgi:peptidoglycan/xylan/chitin deacetylase (PgdA/CDA1 family)
MSARFASTRAKAAIRGALRRGFGGRAARAVAAARGRALALVYHRVVADPGPPGVVPAVAAGLFRRHVEALAEIGDVVALDELLADASPRSRPRFALTFDDDFDTHRGEICPALTAARVPGTFFLSGRSLHGLGPYWFEALDALVLSDGPAATARRLGVDARDLEDLVAACERDPTVCARAVAEAGDVKVSHLDAVGIRALVDAGMAIGFHTLEHPVLVGLDDAELREAVVGGRTELEAATGRTLRHFAYPHGKADARTARAVADAGFTTGWTGRPAAVGRRSDPFRLGRWEPGAASVDDLLVGIAIRLNGDSRA